MTKKIEKKDLLAQSFLPYVLDEKGNLSLEKLDDFACRFGEPGSRMPFGDDPFGACCDMIHSFVYCAASGIVLGAPSFAGFSPTFQSLVDLLDEVPFQYPREGGLYYIPGSFPQRMESFLSYLSQTDGPSEEEVRVRTEYQAFHNFYAEFTAIDPSKDPDTFSPANFLDSRLMVLVWESLSMPCA